MIGTFRILKAGKLGAVRSATKWIVRFRNPSTNEIIAYASNAAQAMKVAAGYSKHGVPYKVEWRFAASTMAIKHGVGKKVREVVHPGSEGVEYAGSEIPKESLDEQKAKVEDEKKRLQLVISNTAKLEHIEEAHQPAKVPRKFKTEEIDAASVLATRIKLWSRKLHGFKRPVTSPGTIGKITSLPEHINESYPVSSLLSLGLWGKFFQRGEEQFTPPLAKYPVVETVNLLPATATGSLYDEFAGFLRREIYGSIEREKTVSVTVPSSKSKGWASGRDVPETKRVFSPVSRRVSAGIISVYPHNDPEALFSLGYELLLDHARRYNPEVHGDNFRQYAMGVLRQELKTAARDQEKEYAEHHGDENYVDPELESNRYSRPNFFNPQEAYEAKTTGEAVGQVLGKVLTPLEQFVFTSRLDLYNTKRLQIRTFLDQGKEGWSSRYIIAPGRELVGGMPVEKIGAEAEALGLGGQREVRRDAAQIFNRAVLKLSRHLEASKNRSDKEQMITALTRQVQAVRGERLQAADPSFARMTFHTSSEDREALKKEHRNATQAVREINKKIGILNAQRVNLVAAVERARRGKLPRPKQLREMPDEERLATLDAARTHAHRTLSATKLTRVVSSLDKLSSKRIDLLLHRDSLKRRMRDAGIDARLALEEKITQKQALGLVLWPKVQALEAKRKELTAHTPASRPTDQVRDLSREIHSLRSKLRLSKAAKVTIAAAIQELLVELAKLRAVKYGTGKMKKPNPKLVIPLEKGFEMGGPEVYGRAGGRPRPVVQVAPDGSRGSGFWHGKSARGKLKVVGNDSENIDREGAEELTDELSPPAQDIDRPLRRALVVTLAKDEYAGPRYAFPKGKERDIAAVSNQGRGHASRSAKRDLKKIVVAVKSTSAEAKDLASYLKPFQWFTKRMEKSFDLYLDKNTRQWADEWMETFPAYAMGDGYLSFIKKGAHLFYHQYAGHPESGRELLKRMYKANLRVPYAMAEIATATTWNEDWPFEHAVKYEEWTDRTIARAMQYAIVFHPSSKKEAQDTAAFLNRNARRPSEGWNNSVPFSWSVPDFRSTLSKTVGFEPRVLNSMLYAGKEFMALSKSPVHPPFDTMPVQVNTDLAVLIKSNVRSHSRDGALVRPYFRGYHRQAQEQVERVLGLLSAPAIPKTAKKTLERMLHALQSARPLSSDQVKQIKEIEAKLWHRTASKTTLVTTRIEKAILTKKKDDTKAKKPGRAAKASAKSTSTKTGKRTYRYPAALQGKQMGAQQQPLPPPPPIDINALASRMRTTSEALRQYAAKHKDADAFADHFELKHRALVDKHGVPRDRLKTLYHTLVPPTTNG